MIDTMSVEHVVLLATARTHAANGTGRAIRQRARLSLGDVARAIGSSGPVVSRWENGLRMPSGPPAVRWSQLLAELEKALPVVRA
jgi:DNA-binding transcriptional regulator YiaG